MSVPHYIFSAAFSSSTSFIIFLIILVLRCLSLDPNSVHKDIPLRVFCLLVSTKTQLGIGMPQFLPSFVVAFVSSIITVGLWSKPQSSLARILCFSPLPSLSWCIPFNSSDQLLCFLLGDLSGLASIPLSLAHPSCCLLLLFEVSEPPA